MFTSSTDLRWSNATDHRPRTLDCSSAVERRTTEIAYLVVSSYAFIPAEIMLRSNATDLLVCPSTVVQSVGLVVGEGMLSNSQHDIHRTVIVLLNLCLTIKFAGNFVFYVTLRKNRCGGGDRRRAPDQQVIALYQFQTLDAARSSHHTDHTCVINGRAAVDTTVSYTWPDRRRTVLSTRTVSSV